jgi:hypothetical protein
VVTFTVIALAGGWPGEIALNGKCTWNIPTRRGFLATSVGAVTASTFTNKVRSAGSTFNLWAFGDAHVGTDERNGRKSLAEAISQSEFGGKEGGPPFDWDIAVNVGDMSGAQGLPVDQEGRRLFANFVHSKNTSEKIFTTFAETTTAVALINQMHGGSRNGLIYLANTPSSRE